MVVKDGIIIFLICCVLLIILVISIENLREIKAKEDKERRKNLDLSMSWSGTGLNEVREDKERKDIDK